MRRLKTKIRGFTLIEVLVTLAIVGILAAIAYPSFVEQMAKGKRAEARATLLEASQYMERQYSARSSYTATLPARLTVVPSTGKTNYSVTVAASATGYTLTAAPVAVDPCGSLLLFSTGGRSATGSLSVTQCWK